MVLNFMTHLPSRRHPFFAQSDAATVADYLADFRRVFAREPRCESVRDWTPSWSQVSRLAMYSPVFHRDYRNPPVRSRGFRNLFFAGNQRTFPSIASTGTALRSGLEAAAALASGYEAAVPTLAAVAAFRPGPMPRA